MTIGTLSRLTKALDKLSRAGVLRKNGGGRMPVYLTEYGYFASGKRALPTKTRSRYLQQAYTIALKNGRVKSQLQYLLPTLPNNSHLDVQHRDRDPDRQAPAAVQRAAALVQRPTAARSSARVARSTCRRRPPTPPAETCARLSFSAGPACTSSWRPCRTSIVRAALRGGVDMVQLRAKGASDDEILAAAARFRALCDEHGALFWLNDRPDLALEARADGVHVGQDDLPVDEVREQVGYRLLIGLSTPQPGAVRRRAPVRRRTS